MLYLIPAPAHRRLLRVAHAVRRQWWRWRQPALRGCRVLAFDAEERVLLIRHSYGSGKWMPPGGGLGRRESAIAGALRELREETSCLLEDAREVAVIEERLHGAGNLVHVIAGRTASDPCVDRREVIEACFFALDALPDFMPDQLHDELDQWVRAWRGS